jgi:hypothetical protein
VGVQIDDIEISKGKIRKLSIKLEESEKNTNVQKLIG